MKVRRRTSLVEVLKRPSKRRNRASVAGITSGTVPDATTSTKGKVKLAGDLSGTADSPTVPGLAGKASSSDSRFPSSGEKSALAGTSGTPGSGNKYVTNADSRLSDQRVPTANSVDSSKIIDNSIVDADVNPSADIQQSKIQGLLTALSGKAPLNSPTFTGDPQVPTPSPGDTDQSIANTAFVKSEVGLAAAGFTVKPQAEFATVQALSSYTGSGTGVLEASANGSILSALGLESEWWQYSATFKWIGVPLAVCYDRIGGYVYGTYNVSGTFMVVKFDSSGNYVLHWGTTGTGNGQFFVPGGICVAGDGTKVYVADTGNSRIQRFSTSGTYEAQVGSAGSGNGQFNNPQGLAGDPSGHVWVCDSGNNRLQRITWNTMAYIDQFGTVGTGNGEFRGPVGVACDDWGTGALWVTDYGNNRVQKFNSSKVYQSQFGTAGSGDGQFNKPKGIALDSSLSLYVADTGNSRVQKFNSSGTYQKKVGGLKSASHGAFDSPGGVAVTYAAANGTPMFVADTGNNRIEKLDYITTTPVVTGQSVLVKDQNYTGPHVDHGVFTVLNVGSGSTKWKLQRRADLDTSAEVPSGLLVNVLRRGPFIPGGMWYVSTADPITLDTTPLMWEKFSPGGYPNPHQESHGPNGTDRIEGLGYGVLGFHQLNTAFTTSGTHTTFQDEGLTTTVSYRPGRRLKVTLEVHVDAPGGTPQIIRFQVLRGSTLVGWWQHRAEAAGISTHVYQNIIETVNEETQVFKVQICAAAGNTSVKSHGDYSFTRQLIVEDIGPVATT